MWDFLRMGGYWPYVWSAYGITFLLLLGLVAWTVRLRRRRHRELAEAEAKLGAGRAEAPRRLRPVRAGGGEG